LESSARSLTFRKIDLDRLGLPEPSTTFHGRDVFAPVGAELAAGHLDFGAVGPEHVPSVESALPRTVVTPSKLEGQVVAIDTFGNLITNIDHELLESFSEPVVRVRGVERPVRRTYSDESEGEVVAVVNAFGTVEVARRNGNAARFLEVGRGEKVVVASG
jgi:hypothetical protein